nr:Unknown Function [uncultured bacterium]
MMSDASPEAWLGQFLIELGLETHRGTLAGARADPELMRRLGEIHRASSAGSPLRMLEPEFVERLRTEDWAAWWRGQEEAARYCYSTLALSLLGDTSHASDLAVMYRQQANSRIRKDAHYVLCYTLGKDWPRYVVTESDLERLASGQQPE